MLVQWLNAAPKSTKILLVFKKTAIKIKFPLYLLIVVWTMIWEVGRVDITF